MRPSNLNLVGVEPVGFVADATGVLPESVAQKADIEIFPPAVTPVGETPADPSASLSNRSTRMTPLLDEILTRQPDGTRLQDP